MASSRGIVVFSGGSAANSLVDVFNRISESSQCPLSYIIPISDNGGSSSELIRVFGGPGIGDLRSRLVRLIPQDGRADPERMAIKAFFNHRLSADSQSARLEWLDIVEARHALWKDISSPKKELIRSFLNLLNLEIVKRARPSSVFNFESASIGNLFLTGARLFSGSLESAIYLLSSLCQIPASISVLPILNTNFSHHICAALANDTTIAGQNAISHPSAPTSVPGAGAVTPLSHPSSTGIGHPSYFPTSNSSFTHLTLPQTDPESPTRHETEHADTIEDANLPGSLPTLRKPYITFLKPPSTNSPHTHQPDDLPARITRIFYINPYGQEIRPPANPKALDALSAAQAIIYSIGSLYTSIVPSLIARGVGDAVATSPASLKILILNGTLDRETGGGGDALSGLDFVRAVAKAAGSSSSSGRARRLVGAGAGAGGEESGLAAYVSHVIYLEGEGAPKVDKALFAKEGIEAIRVYGRGGRYDEKALGQALEAVVGRRNDARVQKGRRNTLVA